LAAWLLDESPFAFFASANAVYLYEADAKIQLTPVNANRLREIIDSALCSTQLVLRDGRYEQEHHQLQLSRTDLVDVLDELLKHAPVAPQSIKKLSAMEIDHARQRLRTGEHPADIGRAYGVSERVISELRRAANG
jgi:hypothetical protein